MAQSRTSSTPVDALGSTIASQSSRLTALETVAHRHDTDSGRFVKIIGDTMTGPLLNENSAAGTGRMASVDLANQDGSGGSYIGTTLNSLLIGTDQSTNLHLGANRRLGLTVESSGDVYLNSDARNYTAAGQMVGSTRIIETRTVPASATWAVGSNVLYNYFSFNINTLGIRHSHVVVWFNWSCYIDAPYAIKGRINIGGTLQDHNFFSNEGASHKEFSMIWAKAQTESSAILIEGGTYAIGGAVRGDVNDAASITVAVA